MESSLTNAATLDCSHQTRTQLPSACASTLVPTQLPRHACRTPDTVWLVCFRWTFDVQLSQHFTAHLCFIHVNESQLHRTIVSRCSLGHGVRNQKLDRLKRLLCVVAFLHLLRHPAIFSQVLFVASKTFVITCVHRVCRVSSHFVRLLSSGFLHASFV